MEATMLYLATVASCLYLPMWFPPGFEGPDLRIAFALAMASATQAALRPRTGIDPRWEKALAVAWTVGCTLCTPHMFPPPSDMQVAGTLLGAGVAGVVLVTGAIAHVLRNPALRPVQQRLYGLALVLVGVAFARYAALLVVSAGSQTLRAFLAAILGCAVLVAVGAIEESVRGRRTRR